MKIQLVRAQRGWWGLSAKMADAGIGAERTGISAEWGVDTKE